MNKYQKTFVASQLFAAVCLAFLFYGGVSWRIVAAIAISLSCVHWMAVVIFYE